MRAALALCLCLACGPEVEPAAPPQTCHEVRYCQPCAEVPGCHWCIDSRLCERADTRSCPTSSGIGEACIPLD